MHHDGHSRAHSMQTVQFSSISAMTPRERGGSSGSTSGYCAVTDLRVSFRRVTASPVSRPRAEHQLSHHHDGREHELEQRERHQPHPGEPLQLVLAQPRDRRPAPR